MPREERQLDAATARDPYQEAVTAFRELVAHIRLGKDEADRVARAKQSLLLWNSADLGAWEDAAAIVARRDQVRYTPQKPLHLLFDFVLGCRGRPTKKRASEMALTLERLRKMHPAVVKREVKRQGVRALAKAGAKVSPKTKRRSRKLFEAEASGTP